MWASSWSGSISGARAAADAPTRITPTMRTNLRIYLILRAERGFEQDTFAGIQRRGPDFCDAAWPEQTRQYADTIAHAELTVDHGQHSWRTARRREDRFNDASGSDTERLRSR